MGILAPYPTDARRRNHLSTDGQVRSTSSSRPTRGSPLTPAAVSDLLLLLLPAVPQSNDLMTTPCLHALLCCDLHPIGFLSREIMPSAQRGEIGCQRAAIPKSKSESVSTSQGMKRDKMHFEGAASTRSRFIWPPRCGGFLAMLQLLILGAASAARSSCRFLPTVTTATS